MKAFVLWDERPPSGVDDRYWYWDDFMELGANHPEEELIRRRDNCKPNRVCNLVYTSGTTGMPKGVMLTHDNMTYYMQTALLDALKDY